MGHDFKKFPELTNSQFQFYYFDSPHKQITENFTAKVIKVTDGDTVRVDWAERNFDFPIRLARIAAPEIKEGGKESQAWLEDMLLGEEINVGINEFNRVGKWGRLIGEIYFMGMNINNISKDLGHSISFEDLQ